MLLAKIKEALNSLYDDIQTEPELPDSAETEVAAAEEAAPVAEAQADESSTEKEEKKEAEEAEAPPPPPGPRETDYQVKGYHLDAALPPEKVVAAAEILSSENFFIESITGVDWIDEQQLEVVYDFNHFDELCRVAVRSRLDRNNPEIPTISHIYQGAIQRPSQPGTAAFAGRC
jgi:NADH-quinone oxidoreductase subunit C